MTAVPVATKPVGVGWDPRRYFGGFWRHPFARAVLKAVLTVWVTTTLTFFLIRLMPGNPVELKIDELIQTANGALTYDDAKAIASGLFAIDLNAPLHEQYLSFIGSLLRLDLGRSFLSSGTTVTSIILAVLPWTLFSVGTGLLLSFVAGIFLGLLAAYRRNSLLDRIAVLPLVTQLAISVGFIVGGAAVIEQLFAYQGVGKRLLDSVTQRDYPVIQGVVLLTTISVVVANLAADLLYSKLDPRIGRAGGAAG